MKREHNNPGKVSPSMMCAKLASLPEYLEVFAQENIEYLHVDVMDGHFVPNLCLGTDYLRQLRGLSSIPLDIHLMVDKPENMLEWFGFAPSDLVSIHYESTRQLPQVLKRLRDEYGCKTMVAINPETDYRVLEEVLDLLDGVLVMTVRPGFAGAKLVPLCVQKVQALRAFLDDHGKPEAIVAVDGNVTNENARILRDQGADMFIVGSSSVFKEGDTAQHIRNFRTYIA